MARTTGSKPAAPTASGQGRQEAEGRQASYGAVLSAAQAKLADDHHVRQSLPHGGGLHIDRRVPFLVLYRRPQGEDSGTAQLVTTEASYLQVTLDKRDSRDVKRLVQGLGGLLAESFGTVLLVEIWSRPAASPAVRVAQDGGAWPCFRLFRQGKREDLDPLLELLQRRLTQRQLAGRIPEVEIVQDPRLFPERRRPVLTPAEAARVPCVQVGIEVEPIFRNAEDGGVYPELLRAHRARLGSALKHLFFEFAREHTSHRPKSFHSLGRRVVVKAVWEVDARLDEVGSAFDMLLEASPINAESLWRAFRRSGFEKLHRLRYRPLPFDPVLTKRRLYDIPMERIEDPTISHLLREKQAELDRQLTMLCDRESPRFLLGSIQLYGGISPELLRVAEEIFERVPATGHGGTNGHGVSADEFRRRAEAELQHYRNQWEGFAATVRESKRVIAGLMVSRGHLLVAAGTRTPAARVDALLQHEVGTHLVTYYNGLAQRFTQLRTGFAGYEELQEGLAVVAEYLVGGMTASRLRTLAGRVVGAKLLIDGAGPIDTFRLLCRYGFKPRPAFNIMLRLFRGGGLVKDAIYLRGLIRILEYIAGGGDLEPLFVGKIAAEHIPLIRELIRRGIVKPPRLKPRFLEFPGADKRLERLRAGVRVIDLVG